MNLKSATYLLVALSAFAIGWRGYAGAGRGTGFVDSLEYQFSLLGARIMGTPVSSMKLSTVGLNAIAQREGFSPAKYKDADGYSIGFGHFIKPGQYFTEPMRESTGRILLEDDARIASDAVRAYVKVPLSQNEFDALVSFTYNVGVGAFGRSTLLKVLNSGDYSGAAMQFDRWHIPVSVISRRNSEKAQFLA